MKGFCLLTLIMAIAESACEGKSHYYFDKISFTMVDVGGKEHNATVYIKDCGKIMQPTSLSHNF